MYCTPCVQFGFHLVLQSWTLPCSLGIARSSWKATMAMTNAQQNATGLDFFLRISYEKFRIARKGRTCLKFAFGTWSVSIKPYKALRRAMNPARFFMWHCAAFHDRSSGIPSSSVAMSVAPLVLASSTRTAESTSSQPPGGLDIPLASPNYFLSIRSTAASAISAASAPLSGAPKASFSRA